MIINTCGFILSLSTNALKNLNAATFRCLSLVPSSVAALDRSDSDSMAKWDRKECCL